MYYNCSHCDLKGPQKSNKFNLLEHYGICKNNTKIFITRITTSPSHRGLNFFADAVQIKQTTQSLRVKSYGHKINAGCAVLY